MDARRHRRAALAAVFAVAGMEPALAGGHGGGHGGPILRPGMGSHGFGAFRGGWRSRGLPPISGVIHERPGMTPYTSAYGHTNTAVRFGGPAWSGRGGGAFYGHTGTSLRYGAAGWAGGAPYGHAGTALPVTGRPGPYAAGEDRARTSLRYDGARRGYGREALRERRRFAGGRFLGGYGGGYGGFGVGLDGAPGPYGDPGAGGAQGTYGPAGTYGSTGTYGLAGTYGGGGTYGGFSYLSERPLAARFAEPPLAPGPGASYSPADRYAYAASDDVGPGPRVLRVHRGYGAGCGCGAAPAPTFYRYGVGTAY